jgi:hypothetical protein
MKSGPRLVFRYSSTHEKALPNGSIRRRMELHRTPHSRPQRTRTPQDPQSSRDPRGHLLPPKERLPVAPAPARLPPMAHRLPLLQAMAYRWYLREDQPSSARTPASALEARSRAQRGRGGFSVGKEHRGGRRTARLRWGQEGKGRKRHILVDTEGFVLKAYVHSAKVMDFEKGSRCCYGGRTSAFPVCGTCGWTRATAGRTRARTGCARPWDGASISSSVRRSPPPKRY